ncbi:MAG TPA: lipoate-protein ligase B, partial [Myxococcota bacterium]|nr:lipoate-protein ligase B [Myxococcota bacterium]
MIPFSEGLARMRALAERRAAGEGEDTLLLMRHPEVLSVGRRRGARDNILNFEIPVVEVDRGGDVTWHGPGQLVGYPVVRLRDGERDVVRVLRQLEDGLIEVLSGLGLVGAKNPPHT